ncbi:MAG: class I SAM-dependent methyltransferase [Gammaproteobacteria bacterium]|nr:class I SAM-dependent methyltransferase [Gammaproteobacteria bacterium]
MLVIAIESVCFDAFPILALSLDEDSYVVVTSHDDVDRQRYPLVMVFHEGRLSLSVFDVKQPLFVSVDFVSGRSLYRNKNKTVKNELLAKAVGLKASLEAPLKVVDATAGFGRDSFLLASFGCEVLMLERSPLMVALLTDGMKRAEAASEAVRIINRMRLTHGDAVNYFSSLGSLVDDEGFMAFRPDVIYLDPMFPGSNKNAQVKKEMRVLRLALGEDNDGEEMIDKARSSGVKRVVVKRPRKGKLLGGIKPSYQVLGKSARFDVYFP